MALTMQIVSDAARLQSLLRQLENSAAIGVDTEADSFHSYREKTCLLQISTPDQDYVVDPLALPDLSSLTPVFADPRVCKVFHAAENDVAGLRRDFGFDTVHLFDTMTAARILGLPRVGLGDLLKEHFAVETNKRFQRHDWGRRPLDADSLTYAAIDSRYLVRLRDRLLPELERTGRLEEAREEFRRLEKSTARERTFDPQSFWRIKGSYALPPRGRAILRELHIWRDGQAAALDRPPFRVAPDSALLAIAEQPPSSLSELRQIAGLPEGIARRFGPALLAAAVRAARAADPQPPAPKRPDEAVQERYEALRSWRKALAAQRGVDPDVVVSNATLQAIAEHRPRTLDELKRLEAIGPWKLRNYGEALLNALSAHQSEGGRIRSRIRIQLPHASLTQQLLERNRRWPRKIPRIDAQGARSLERLDSRPVIAEQVAKHFPRVLAQARSAALDPAPARREAPGNAAVGLGTDTSAVRRVVEPGKESPRPQLRAEDQVAPVARDTRRHSGAL